LQNNEQAKCKQPTPLHALQLNKTLRN